MVRGAWPPGLDPGGARLGGARQTDEVDLNDERKHTMGTFSARTAAGIGVMTAAGLLLTACPGGGGTPDPGESGAASEGTTTAEITFWDPYPQREAGSEWDTLVKACAPEGSTITRSSAPQTESAGAPASQPFQGAWHKPNAAAGNSLMAAITTNAMARRREFTTRKSSQPRAANMLIPSDATTSSLAG